MKYATHLNFGEITDNNICLVANAGMLSCIINLVIYGIKKGQGVCAGDSGGPLVYTEQENDQLKNYLVGVTSFRPLESSAKLTSVFTRVAKYLDFIKPTVLGLLATKTGISDACIHCC